MQWLIVRFSPRTCTIEHGINVARISQPRSRFTLHWVRRWRIYCAAKWVSKIFHCRSQDLWRKEQPKSRTHENDTRRKKSRPSIQCLNVNCSIPMRSWNKHAFHTPGRLHAYRPSMFRDSISVYLPLRRDLHKELKTALSPTFGCKRCYAIASLRYNTLIHLHFNRLHLPIIGNYAFISSVVNHVIDN